MQNAHWKITQPCHEPIENMDVSANGHYCHSCKKEVLNLDGIKPQDIGYKTGDNICGRISGPNASVAPVGRWSSFMLKYFGIAALFFIPLKKGKTQNQVQENKPDLVPQKKFLTKPKRLIGELRGADGRPLRTQVTMTDNTGQVIADTMSIANGRYLLEVDTTKIKGDSLTITAKDTAYVWQMDSVTVTMHPRDSIYIVQVVNFTTGSTVYIQPVITTSVFGWTSGIINEDINTEYFGPGEKPLPEVDPSAEQKLMDMMEDRVYNEQPIKEGQHLLREQERPVQPEKNDPANPGEPKDHEKQQAVIPPVTGSSNRKDGPKQKK